MPTSPGSAALPRGTESGKLTGRGVIVWLGVGFGVMFAANFALIYIALARCTARKLENPYDASQVYNQQLAAARAQDSSAGPST